MRFLYYHIVSRWLLSQKWDFSIYGYKYDKWEGWTSKSMSLDAKYDFNSSLFELVRSLNLIAKSQSWIFQVWMLQQLLQFSGKNASLPISIFTLLFFLTT